MTRIEEIKERLAKATPGPWGLCASSNGGAILLRGKERPLRERHIQSHLQIVPSGDAEFIANAPADIAWLLEQLPTEQVDAGYDDLGREVVLRARADAGYAAHAGDVRFLATVIDDLREQLAAAQRYGDTLAEVGAELICQLTEFDGRDYQQQIDRLVTPLREAIDADMRSADSATEETNHG